MQLIERDFESEAVLLRILCEAFPQRSAEIWQAGFDRMAVAYAGLPDQPVVWLLGNPDDPDGIMLGLPNPCTAGPDPQSPLQLNLSSWYVREQHRSQSVWMLRKAVARKDRIYTDLTPTDNLARLLPALGFKPISAGSVRIPLLRIARLRQADWTIFNADITLERTDDPVLRQALREHLRLGCLVAGIGFEDRCFPVVLLRRWRKRIIPVAELIYLPLAGPGMPDLREALPSLAVALLKQGVMYLEMEQSAQTSQQLKLPHSLINTKPRFARGDYSHGGINHLYSEFVYFQS